MGDGRSELNAAVSKELSKWSMKHGKNLKPGVLTPEQRGELQDALRFEDYDKLRSFIESTNIVNWNHQHPKKGYDILGALDGASREHLNKLMGEEVTELGVAPGKNIFGDRVLKYNGRRLVEFSGGRNLRRPPRTDSDMRQQKIDRQHATSKWGSKRRHTSTLWQELD